MRATLDKPCIYAISTVMGSGLFLAINLVYFYLSKNTYHNNISIDEIIYMSIISGVLGALVGAGATCAVFRYRELHDENDKVAQRIDLEKR